MRFDREPCLVLSVRPYRETSVLCRVLLRNKGCISAVMKGVRGGRRVSELQPFSVGLLSGFGRSTLLTATRFETETHHNLSGNQLALGFYILEVINRVLTDFQAEPVIYDLATQTLDSLAEQEERLTIEATLRRFELLLLVQLGYGLDFQTPLDAVSPEQHTYFTFTAESGFTVARGQASGAPDVLQTVGDTTENSRLPREPNMFSAQQMQRLAALCAFLHGGTALTQEGVNHLAGDLRTLQNLAQQQLEPLLGHEPLVSRALWKAPSGGAS